MTLERYGYVTRAGQDILLCDLTPPVHAGTEIAVELIDGPAFYATGTRREWRMSVGAVSSDARPNPQPFHGIVADGTSVQIRGELLAGGRTVIDISNTLAVTSDPTVMRVWRSGNNLEKAIIEITTDLAAYITAAANATGANGISPRFLAAVLLIEITNRPKSGRAEELREVYEEIAELMIERHGTSIFRSFNFNIFLHKSIGVGQTKLSTLAMALGWMPLFEHNRVGESSSANKEIQAAFMRLTSDQMFELWRRLAWTKSAVDSIAKILTHLKNRANRYPSMSRANFAINSRAMQIVATEYNMGATNSPERAAGPTGYGQIVEAICNGSATGTMYDAASISFRMFAHP